MNSLEWWVAVFRNNWRARGDCDPRWRRIHRLKAKQAIAEIRFYLDRPRKAFGPSTYGHGLMA